MKMLDQLEVRLMFDEVSGVIIDFEYHDVSINACNDHVRIFWWDYKNGNDIFISESSNKLIAVDGYKMYLMDTNGEEHTAQLLVAMKFE